jgi:hypothetical protein
MKREEVLHSRYSDHIDEFEKLSVTYLVKGLREAISWHINARDMLLIDAVLVLLFSVLVVVVDVLCSLMMAVLADHIERWFVVSIELKRLKLVALVANLSQETAK